MDSFGKTPLHYASENGHLNVVEYLVNTHHCDPTQPPNQELTPLHYAAKKGHLEIINFFSTTQNCDSQVKTAQNVTPLHCAAACGHLAIVKILIKDMKNNPNCRDKSGRSPLHYASEYGHLDIVKYLVEKCRCDPLCRNLRDSNTPLHLAAKNNHLKVVKYFIDDKKCDPNITGRNYWRPLNFAIWNGHFAVSKYLIDREDCDVRDTVVFFCFNRINFLTPLRMAVMTGKLDIVMYLTAARRLDPYLQSDRKRLMKDTKSIAMLDCFESYSDPLHDAVMSGNIETVEYYIEEKKWSPKLLDRHGNNALHSAAQYGQLKVVKYLIDPLLDRDPKLACDPLAKNKYGQTAQQLASRGDHQHVVSYLLRTTTDRYTLSQHGLSPSMNIFVLGNSGAGKSTLVKALSKEGHAFGKLFKVSGVIPLTAGIVPTIVHSKVFGRVSIYDFAGHEEYYASHEMILQQTSHPLVLIAVDISLPIVDMKKQLLYWVSLLSSYSIAKSKTLHVLVVGSHADQVKADIQREIEDHIMVIMNEESVINCHGLICCDCRYSTSVNLNQLRQKLGSICRSIRLFIGHNESDYSNRLCASLMCHLQQSGSKLATVTVGKVHKQIKSLKYPSPTLIQLVDLNLLIDVCKTLSSNGHLIFLPHDKIMKKSLLIFDEKVILSQVHACLQRVKQALANEIGMFESKSLQQVLSHSLGNLMEPELAIKYLIFTQFCTEITADQLVNVPHNVDTAAADVHYFFPNLVLATRPADLWSTGEQNYTQLYTWCLKRTNPRHFFTPRYIHTLFIQLIKCENDIRSMKYVIWKNGILLVHNNGTRSMIEITEQTSRLNLEMQCVKGCELHLVEWRASLISLVKSLVRSVCPNIQTAEFLIHSLPPNITSEVSIAEISYSVLNGHQFVTEKTTLRHISLSDLLYFDSFHMIDESLIKEIFARKEHNQQVCKDTLTSVCEAVCVNRQLYDKLITEASKSQLTYSQMYTELHKHTIFPEGNLCVLAGVKVEPIKDLPLMIPDMDSYISSLPAPARPHLECQLDWGNGRVQRDLNAIAYHMLDWEENLSVHLGLTDIDVHDIKMEYMTKPELQRRAALTKWQDKEGLHATYGNLLEVFVKAGHMQCAEALCEVLRKKYPTSPKLKIPSSSQQNFQSSPIKL